MTHNQNASVLSAVADCPKSASPSGLRSVPISFTVRHVCQAPPPIPAALESRGKRRILCRDRRHGPAAGVRLFRGPAATPADHEAHEQGRRLAARPRHHARTGIAPARLTALTDATVSRVCRALALRQSCVNLPLRAILWGERVVPSRREKTISYRRAVWVDGVLGITLESCIRDAHTKLKSLDERTIGHGGQLTKSAKQRNRTAGGLFLHLTVETPGEAASIVPHVSKTASEVDLKTQKAPANAEYLDGDAFLFVCNDHVCVCATQIHDGAIKYFLWEFFKKANLRKDSIRFDLVKMADVSKLKLLHAQGVKEIELDAALYKAAADFTQRKEEAYGALGAVGKFFKSLIDKPYDVTPDGLMVNVGLRIDRRFQKHISVGYKTIEQIAADAVRNHHAKDDYTIITKSGQRISPREIFVRTKVSIDSQGKTVDRDKTWRELGNFYDVLKASGVLEE